MTGNLPSHLHLLISFSLPEFAVGCFHVLCVATLPLFVISWSYSAPASNCFSANSSKTIPYSYLKDEKEQITISALKKPPFHRIVRRRNQWRIAMGENDLEGFITPLSTNGMDTSLQAEERLHVRIFRKSAQYMENSVSRVCDYFIDMRMRVIKLSACFLYMLIHLAIQNSVTCLASSTSPISNNNCVVPLTALSNALKIQACV